MAQRPTPEQLGDYFCKGLRKSLQGSVARRDIQNQVDFTDMVNVALRAQRRMGKTSKKRKDDSDDEDTDSDSD